MESKEGDICVQKRLYMNKKGFDDESIKLRAVKEEVRKYNKCWYASDQQI